MKHVFLLFLFILCIRTKTNAFRFHELNIRSSARHCMFSIPPTKGLPPNHVAFIVDGNGRWATERGRSRTEGHAAGAHVTVDIVKKSFELGVTYVTLYLFR